MTWHLADLEVFVRGGRAVLDGTNPYQTTAGDLEFTYPPFAAVALVPLALLGNAAGWVLSVLSLASLSLVAGVSFRRGLPRPSHQRSTDLLWVLALVLVAWATEPVQRTLIFGQVNLILCALVVADAFLVPARFRGVLTGLASGVKLTPAFFVVYFAVRREWQSAARCAASGAVTVLLGWLVLPTESTRYWFKDLTAMGKFGGYALEPTNQSLRAMWVRLFDGNPGLWYPISSALVVLLAGIAARRLTRAGDDLAALTVVAAGALLVSPISWTHHWVWVVPALVVMARRGWWVATVVVTLLMYLPPMWAADGDPLRLTAMEQVVASTYVLMALLYLVVMAWSRPQCWAADLTARD